VSPSLLRARSERTPWNLRVPFLASFHADTVVGDGGVCGDDHPTLDLRGYMLSTGLDATYWFPSVLGFSVRLLGGVGSGRVIESGTFGSNTGWMNVGTYEEFSLMFGLSFR
jgi:hypothetical protein